MNTIRPARDGDADRLYAIYNHYVLTDVATFEEEPVSPVDMRQRVEDVQKAFFWLVYETDRGWRDSRTRESGKCVPPTATPSNSASMWIHSMLVGVSANSCTRT